MWEQIMASRRWWQGLLRCCDENNSLLDPLIERRWDGREDAWSALARVRMTSAAFVPSPLSVTLQPHTSGNGHGLIWCLCRRSRRWWWWWWWRWRWRNGDAICFWFLCVHLLFPVIAIIIIIHHHSLCMYVCMYVCVCMYASSHTYTHTYKHKKDIHTWNTLYIYTFFMHLYVSLCVCMYVCMSVYMHEYAHSYIHAYGITFTYQHVALDQNPSPFPFSSFLINLHVSFLISHKASSFPPLQTPHFHFWAEATKC